MTKKILLAFFFLLCLGGLCMNNYKTQDTVSEADATFNKNLSCMTLNIYNEARGEPDDGKKAVAQVTINRTLDRQFPSTICEVVYQKTGHTPQFSWTSNPNSKITDNVAWVKCQDIARKALTVANIHPKLAQAKALYYKAYYSKSKWHKKYIVATIGSHTFYTDL